MWQPHASSLSTHNIRHCTLFGKIFQAFFTSFPYFFQFREIREKVPKFYRGFCACCTYLSCKSTQNLPAGLLFLIFFSDSAAFHGCLRRMRCFPSINNRFRKGTITRRRWKAQIMIVLLGIKSSGSWFWI